MQKLLKIIPEKYNYIDINDTFEYNETLSFVTKTTDCSTGRSHRYTVCDMCEDTDKNFLLKIKDVYSPVKLKTISTLSLHIQCHYVPCTLP